MEPTRTNKPLQDIKLLCQQYRDKKDEYQRIHVKWTKWLTWAKNQPEYYIWAADGGYKKEHLGATIKSTTKKYRHLEPEYDIEAGTPYFALRNLIYHEKSQIALKISNQLKTIWFEKDIKNNWVYSINEIAEAYGQTVNSTYIFLRRFDWFKPRKNPGQVHIPRVHDNAHLRPVK